MVIRNVCLVGGPPWGLRFASSPNGRIRVTQVLPDGRADQEGVRIGDIVEAINGQQCTGYKMLNAKVRGARGVLRFRFIRGSALTEGKQFNKHLPPVPVKPTVQESVLEFKTDGSKSLNYLNLKTEPTNISKNMGTAASVKVDDDLMVPARMCKNYLPPEIFPVHEPDFTHSNRHNGGMRDSIRDKKRFFEMLASQKEFHAPIRMDQLQLHQKIEYESPSLLSSDQDTHISGYESIAGDSVGLTQSTIMTDTGRQSVSSSGFTEESFFSVENSAAPSLVTTATSMAIPATSFGQFLSASLYPPTSAIQRERNLELELVSGNPEGSPVPSIPLDNSFSAVQPTYDGQNKIPEKQEFRNEEMMIRTVPLQSSPSPPPPSGTEVTSKNGSISGCMWKLRTEPRDGSNKNSVILKAEGIVEIPKPQSVASLREQIARKLEVKMPYTPPANSHPDSTMTTANCFTKSQRDSVMNGQFSHNLQNGAIPTSVLNTFGPTSNHKSSHQTTPLKQLSVVHEPVERHISCITPVPFNRTGTLSSSAIISSNMSVVATSPHSNIFSPSVIRDKYEDNNDYTDSPASDMGESNQLNDYEKLKPAKQKVDDEPQLSLPSAAASPAVIGAISSRIVTVSERATTVAVKLNPPPLIVNSYSKDGNEMTVRNTEIPASSINQSDIIQADKVRTDAYDIENQSGASSSSVVTTAAAPYEMPPFSKPVELRSKIKPETDSFRELQPKLQSKTPPVIINGLPSTPEGLKAISSTIPRYDAHTENSSWYRTMFRKMHIVDQSDPSVLRCQQRKTSTPVSTVQRVNRSWTPNPQRENQANSLKTYELQSRRSKSVGRYVESQNGVERSYHLTSESVNSRPQEWESGWCHELGAAPSCPSSSSLHLYSTNCFAQQRSKTQHFHLPSYRFQQCCKRGTGGTTLVPPVQARSSSKCPSSGLLCHSLSWSEVEYLCKTLDSKGIHRESFTEQLNKLIKSTAIGERLDQSVMYLQSLLDCLEACATNNSNSKRSRSRSTSPSSLTTPNRYCILQHLTNLTATTPYSSCPPYTSSAKHSSSDKPTTNGQLFGDMEDLRKLTKDEVLIRQKAEKLSEELQQQRNRRHGYVPSASPALQKNFDRFSGLINEFGRPERAITPQAMLQSEIMTCTALFSFKAASPKELSFNRGDVIRVYRAVDINWMEGELNGQIGIFPSSYVQISKNKEDEQIKLVALYPFSARNKNELSLKKGEVLRHLRNIDANWIEGKNIHGQTGIFPKSYVCEAFEVNQNGSNETVVPDRPKTPHTTATSFREENPALARKIDHGVEMEEWRRRYTQEGLSGSGQIPQNAETYQVLYAYRPRNVDELELQENDTVFVIEKCDDGWFIGTSLRTGQFGTFPGNYVERH